MPRLYNQSMSKHKQILAGLSTAYKNDDDNLALLITGSVARDEQSS